MLIVNEIILFVQRYSLASSDLILNMGIWSQHLQRYNEVIQESSLDKTYIGPTGKPLVQSKIAHLLGHAIQHKH